jgi:acyl-CoA reductase-like NAD-dependent aldehyde dehydrogenase
MSRDLNLDVDTPEKVAAVLRDAAEVFRDSAEELASAWQDRHAGRVWREIAKVLERAAVSCDKAVDRYV